MLSVHMRCHSSLVVERAVRVILVNCVLSLELNIKNVIIHVVLFRFILFIEANIFNNFSIFSEHFCIWLQNKCTDSNMLKVLFGKLLYPFFSSLG